MSKRANPTVIGIFVVGAIAIITISILLLSGDIFSKKKIYVIMYFDGSVTGLNIGAPVRFRGVKLGTVTDIKLIVDQKAETTEVPVIAEIDRNSYLVRLPDKIVKASELFLDTKDFVKQGLRAELKLTSILTGQLFIEMEVDPGSSYTLRGDGKINEIPTKPSAIHKITETLEKYPIHEVLNNIATTMTSLDKILSDPAINEILKSINQASKDYGLLAQKLSTNVNSISSELNTTLNKTNRALTSADATFRHVGKTLESADATFIHVDKTLVAAEHMLNTSNSLLSDDSQLMFSLTNTLNDLSNAARSVQNLADTLERQPESLLYGKPAGGD